MSGPDFESTIAVPADHPAFRGHFPGNPLLPGVALLAEVCAAVASLRGSEAGPVRFSNAKFLRPVAPGDALVLRLFAEPRGVRFEMTGPRGLVLSGVTGPA